MKKISYVLVIGMSMPLLSGCAAALIGGGAAGGYYYSENKQSIDNYTSDSWITSKVKSKLLAEKGINSLDISVSTNKGIVYLTGHADSADQRAKAITIAQQTKGVQRVDASNLTVKQ